MYFIGYRAYNFIYKCDSNLITLVLQNINSLKKGKKKMIKKDNKSNKLYLKMEAIIIKKLKYKYM